VTLHPTPTRLELLREVAAGQVVDHSIHLIPYLDRGDGTATRVSAQIDEMYDAGWVAQAPDSMIWHVTDAGRALLAEHAERRG
jgi:hypothetical protein